MNQGSFVWSDTSLDTPFSDTGPNQFCVRAAGGVNLDPTTDINFGTQTRQMLNLWGTSYGIGVQNEREYFRCAGDTNAGFAWFWGGTHSDAENNPGGGEEMMELTIGTVVIDGIGYESDAPILSVFGAISATRDVYGTSFQSTSDRNKKENFIPVDAQAILDKVTALPITSWNFTNNSPAVKHLGPMAQDFHAAFGLNGENATHIASVDEAGVAFAAIQGLNQKVEAGSQNSEVRMQKLEAENADLKQQLAATQKEMSARLALLEKAVALLPEKAAPALASH